MKSRRVVKCIYALILSLACSARAEITLEIVTQGAHQIPIAILPFANESAANLNLSAVVAADLARSGLFTPLNTTDVSPAPADVEGVVWPDWETRHADYLVVGQIETGPEQHLVAKFRLFDVNNHAIARVNLAFESKTSQYRMVAHHIADALLENLVGYGGMFSSHIAYITQQGGQRSLKVAESDGFNEQNVFTSHNPIISPRWSPDGKKIAYVSFELKHPIVVVQTLGTGQRKIVANFKGSNSAPAWSPDGKRMTVVLTKDGHSQIYLIDADGSGSPQRVAVSGGIDTEPCFSPDGQSLYFVSDRDGGPQLYRVGLNDPNQTPQRLSYGSTYVVSPHLDREGHQLTYVQRDEGAFHVMLMDLATGQSQLMTDTSLDESPTFAPNGKYILYSTEVQGRGILGIVSTDGKIRQRLTTQTGDVYEPIWGPLQ